MIRKVGIAIGGLIVLGIALRTVQLAVPGVIADAERGLSPFTAVPLNDRVSVGILAPGEGHWYALSPGMDGSFQREAGLTLFFTPDDGHRAHHVVFQIFPAAQIANWYWGDTSQMQNLGAGGVVSRDGNPVTGELLWSGWIVNDETYYIQVFNGTDIPIDYWLFTQDVIAAELGATTEPTPVGKSPTPVEPTPSGSAPQAGPVEEPDLLLPLASELATAQHEFVAAGDVPPGTPTRLVVPVIGLDSGVVPVDRSPLVIGGTTYGQWNTADNLVGWHNLSARLGQVGNTVLNGHSDLNAAVFRSLKYVEVGDEIDVFSGGQVHHYLVAHKFLVREVGVALEERVENAAWIGDTQDERLTLVTCANPGATHRLIIIALPRSGQGDNGHNPLAVGF